MSNRELLEMAAKAAGIDGKYDSWAGMGFMEGIRIKGNPDGFRVWNPLMYDDQALRVAVKLRLTIDHKEACVNVWDGCIGTGFIQNGDDPGAATRLAIVRAAAEIGRLKK